MLSLPLPLPIFYNFPLTPDIYQNTITPFTNTRTTEYDHKPWNVSRLETYRVPWTLWLWSRRSGDYSQTGTGWWVWVQWWHIGVASACHSSRRISSLAPHRAPGVPGHRSCSWNGDNIVRSSALQTFFVFSLWTCTTILGQSL